MKRFYGRQVLWLVLPVLFVTLYFVFVEPGMFGTLDEDILPDVPAESDPAETVTPQPASPEQETPPPPQNMQLARDRAFISQAFPVLSSWDLAALKPLLAEQTLAGTSDEDFMDVITVLSNRLGSLQSFDMPEPVEPAETLGADEDSGSLQHYRFMARYDAGDAEVDLVLHQSPTASKLYSFNITVPN